MLRLFWVERVGAAVADVAEGAAAGADVAHNHKGGGAAAEAFADIGAAGFFAHGVHFLIAQDILNFEKLLAGGQRGANPCWLFQFLLQRHNLNRDAGNFGRAFVFYAPAVVLFVFCGHGLYLCCVFNVVCTFQVACVWG